MKLFIKHLFRGILRRPLQPIILTLTLAISLTISLVALGIEEIIEDEVSAEQSAAYGSADLTVTQNSTSKSRFMFASDVRDILGEGTRVTGVYELPMYRPVREETLFGAAVDFATVGEIFSLSFSEYSAPTVREVGSAAFLSRDYAKAAELSLGDSFTVEALGYEKSYTVHGISERPFLSSYDCLVDISGVVELLAQDSVLVSALGEGFRPASKIYVDLPEGTSSEEAIGSLSLSDMFAGKTFTDVADRARQESNMGVLSPIVDVAVLCSSLLSVAIGFACLYILSRARSEENATFAAAGARPLYLHLFEYAEMLLYLMLASAVGIPLSVPILSFLSVRSGFQYAEVVLHFPDVLFAVSILLLTGLLTVSIFLVAQRVRSRTGGHRKHPLSPRRLCLFIGAVSVLLLASAFTVPPSVRFSFAVAAVLSLLALLCATLPLLFSALSGASRRFGCVPLRYALKNVSHVRVLHNACRLVALTVCLLLVIAVPIVSSRGYTKIVKTMISGDYVVLGATERTENALGRADGVSSISGLYMSTAAQEDGNFIYAISLDEQDMLSDAMGISHLPKGDSVIISKGQSIALGLSVGDRYRVTIDNTEYEFTVSDIVQSGIGFLVFDCEHFGLSKNMLLVEGDGTLSDAALREELVSALALEVGSVVSFEDVMHEKTDTLQSYINCASLLLAVVLLFTLLGLFDNLYESYRARSFEFSLFSYSGMSKASIRQMKSLELLITLTIGTLVGALTALPALLAIREGLFGYGYDLFTNVLRA